MRAESLLRSRSRVGFRYFAISQMVTGTGTSCSVSGETGREQMRL